MGLPSSIASLLQQFLSTKRIGTFLQTRDIDYFCEPSIAEEAIPQVDILYINGTIAWDITPPMDQSRNFASDFQLHDLDIQFPPGEMTLIAGKFGSGKTLLLLAMLGEARLLHGKISYTASPLLDPACANIDDWALAKNGVAYVPQVSLEINKHDLLKELYLDILAAKP